MTHFMTRTFLGTTALTAIMLAPNVLAAQEYIWAPKNGNDVIGGSGILDQAGLSNFIEPFLTEEGSGFTPFPGFSSIRFIEADPAGNDVVVEGQVDITGLTFDVSGYVLTSGTDGLFQAVNEGPVPVLLNDGSTVMISTALSGEFEVQGDGVLTLGGTQDALQELIVTETATLSSIATSGSFTLTNMGTAINSGAMGSVENLEGTFTNEDSGTIDGDVANFGGVMQLGGTVGGDVSNDATLVLSDGLVAAGTLVNDADATTDTDGGTITFEGGVFNAGAFSLGSGATLIAAFDNIDNGTADIAGALVGDLTTAEGTVTDFTGSVTGAVNNAGLLNATGNPTITGDVINSGTVSLGENTGAGDRLTINGGLSGGGTYALDLDLAGSGSADRIIVADGAVTGPITLAFNTTGRPAIATPQRIQVFDVDDTQANDFTTTSSGLPAANSISVYSLIEDPTTSDLFVIGQINPGVGSVAGNFVLTQSLIGALINRPTSPYVTNLAFDDPDPCGLGGWARIQAGQADASSQSSNGISRVQSTVNADYVGFQAGGDFACFDNTGEGWDLAVGAIVGVNDGKVSQPIYAIDPLDPTRVTSTLTSVTKTDFLQSYVGAYGVATKGPWAADLQFRIERTTFDINNVGEGAMSGIGIDDERVKSKATTLSGAVSYTYAIPDTDFTLVPTVGYARTRGTSGDVDFRDGSDLQIGDFESDIGFVGLTAARSRIDPDGTSILSQFVTATYYHDFSDDIISTFTTPSGDSAGLSNSTLGSFSELSLGVNYIKVLEIGSFADAKQISASVRGDRRFGDEIDSWGLVGQVRVQF